MFDRYFADVPTVIVGPGVKTGVPLLYDNPKEVGPDRVVNTLAAHTLYGGPAIVVDFGTSTNFDVVSEKGEFMGGALAPGVEISVDALAARAARLFKVELVEPRSVIGKTTVEALQSGLVYGFASQVDGMVERISEGARRPARRHRHRRPVLADGRPSARRSTSTSPTSPSSACASSTRRTPDPCTPVAAALLGVLTQPPPS